MTIRLVAPLALAASLFLAYSPQGAAQGKTAKCYLSVNGLTYINGACRIEFMNGDGSFSFDDMKLKTRCLSYDLAYSPGQCSMASKLVTSKGIFGQLMITSPGRAKIYWNGEEASLHAQSEISPVTRNGACWQNNQAKLCAW